MNVSTEVKDFQELDEGILLYHQISATTFVVSGCLTNVLCMTAIVRAGSHKNLGTAFFLNIFVIDFLVSITSLLSVSVKSFTIKRVCDDIWCHVMGFLTNTLIGAELNGLAMISLNCYALIVPGNHLRNHFTNRKRVCIMIMTSYLFPMLVLLLPSFNVWGKFSYGKVELVCTAFRSQDHFGTFIIIFSLILTFPILIGTYVCIFRAVVKSNKVMDKTHTEPSGQNTSEDKKVTRERKQQRARTQLMTSVTSMVVSYAVLYFPVSFLLKADPKTTKWSVYVHLTIYYIGWSHCTVNSLVYTLTNRKLRETLNSLLCNK
ncbi:hypothetical protein FSP39_001030 [Pinctada imbricata]|uniref:G-protein coupled receptors family 1 profile domain-containing protein n=1 Tax=Pinctada imbricata TaxID=66713 RepID=A0AA88XP74_PINIB|nr:hypothetical protein FSP39_001030 [Pinctada imbricata]